MMPSSMFPKFAIYRAISTVIALIQVYIVKKTRPGTASYFHGYFITIYIGGIISLMTTDPGGFSSGYYAGLSLVLIAVNLLMPWRAYL